MSNRAFASQCSLLFLNGVFALAFELVWARRLEQLSGVGLIAVTVTISCFMLGLAFGSWFGGRLCDAAAFQQKAAKLLVGLQAGTTAACLLFSIFIFSSLPYAVISTMGSTVWQACSLLLVIPTLGIGMLLPIACSAKAQDQTPILYSCNLFGSLAGAALTAFWLMSAAGLWLSSLAAITVSLIALCLAVFTVTKCAGFGGSTLTGGVTLAANSTSVLPLKYAIVLTAASGFAGIALEIILTRVSRILLGGSMYALAMVLICYLLSNALGAWAAARCKLSSRVNLFILFLAPLLVAAYLYWGLFFLNRSPWYYLLAYRSLHQFLSITNFAAHLLTSFLLLVVLEFVPIFILGAFFVTVLKLTQAPHKESAVGYLSFAGNLGGAAGAWVSCTALLLCVPIIPLQNSEFLSLDMPLLLRAVSEIETISYHELNQLTSKYRLDFYREGINSTVAVFSNPQHNLRQLRIDGLSEGTLPIDSKQPTSAPTDLSTHLLLARLPLCTAPAHKLNVCLIGYGTGTTANVVLEDPQVQHLQIVELEKCVLEAARFFGNSRVVAHPKVTLHIEDARCYLLSSTQNNDIIICQPSEPWLGGSSDLFTKQYWQICRKRLSANGVLCQWVQLYGLSPALLNDICRSFTSVFPNTALMHEPGAGEVFLLAANSQEDIAKLFLQRCGQDKRNLRQLLMLTPAQLHSLCAQNKAQIITDNNLLLEYAMPQVETDPETCIKANLELLSRL
jgi:spermidine synthase